MRLWDWALNLFAGPDEEGELIELPQSTRGEAGREGELRLELSRPPQINVLVARPTLDQGVPTDDLNYYIDRLRSGCQVIVNLSELAAHDPERARRIYDQLEGARIALEGKSVEIGHQVYLFAPPGTEIELDEPPPAV